MKFNKTNTNRTTNKSGYVAYKMEDRLKLITMVLTTMFGEAKYYGDNTNELIQLAEVTDMNFLAKLTVFTRKEMHMRSVAHALTCVIAHNMKGKEFTKQVVKGVVERPDDITEILACYIDMYGKPIPNALKKGLAEAMNKFDEYQFAKYNRSNAAIKFKDVLKLTHAKPKDEVHQFIFANILEDTLETPYTWEVELSAKGNNKDTWEQLIESDKVGYMALLRNLRNIINANPSNIDKVYNKLQNKYEVLKSKQLPFRFYTAYRNLPVQATSKVFDTLEIAIEHSIENIEKIKGKTLIAIDVSGSMRNPISSKSDVMCSDIACLMAAMANKICEEAIVVSFDTYLRSVTISGRGGIIQNAKSISVTGGGTNIALPLIHLIQNNIKVDRMILFSDNEINQSYSYRGYKETCQTYADEYRREVNPDFFVHAIDLQGYGTQQFIGSKTNIIAGWSEKVLEFINLAEQDFGNIVTKINDYEI